MADMMPNVPGRMSTMPVRRRKAKLTPAERMAERKARRAVEEAEDANRKTAKPATAPTVPNRASFTSFGMRRPAPKPAATEGRVSIMPVGRGEDEEDMSRKARMAALKAKRMSRRNNTNATGMGA